VVLQQGVGVGGREHTGSVSLVTDGVRRQQALPLDLRLSLFSLPLVALKRLWISGLPSPRFALCDYMLSHARVVVACAMG